MGDLRDGAKVVESVGRMLSTVKDSFLVFPILLEAPSSS